MRTCEVRKVYHGLDVRVFVPSNLNAFHPYPWRYDVKGKDGRWHLYRGVPNYCATKRSALGKAWHKAKKLQEEE